MRIKFLSVAAVAALVLGASAAEAQQEPPRRLDFSTDTVVPQRAQRGETSREIRSAFVRDQTILGLTVYGPAFATMVGNDGVTGTAGYLVMAGGSFFAAAELARRMEITEGRWILSTAMAWRSAGSALLMAAETGADRRPAAAATLIGGLAGTGAGLWLGKGLSGGEATAMVFGHDLAYVSAIALSFAADPDLTDSGVMDERFAAAWTLSGLLGYAGGRLYARRAPYNITVGDVRTMWLGAAVGMVGAGAFIVESDPSPQATALTLLGGALIGTVGADRFLVRKFDHSRGDGGMVSLGALAGGVMGVGIGVLVAGEANRGESLTLGLATLGAVGGIALTERYLQTSRDAGRASQLGRLTFDPLGALAAATNTPGRHSLLRYTF